MRPWNWLSSMPPTGHRWLSRQGARCRAHAWLGVQGHRPRTQVAEFSGGWRVRLAMARALGSRADLLLLDEPTNHLDLDAIVWLEEWLTAFPGTLLMISHDREFLDAIIDRVLHIEKQVDTRLLGQLLAVRAKAHRGIGAAADAADSPDAAHRGDHLLRQSLPRQRHQVAPGAEPLENAAADGAHRPGACRQSLRIRIRDSAQDAAPLLTVEGAACGYADRSIVQGINVHRPAGPHRACWDPTAPANRP
jgi:ATP-binding cassette subfamily F protein 3